MAFGGRTFGAGEAKSCGGQDGNCLERWIPKTGAPFDDAYVRMAETCCALGSNLFADPRYDLVYNGRGAMIFVRRLPTASDTAVP